MPGHRSPALPPDALDAQPPPAPSVLSAGAAVSSPMLGRRSLGPVPSRPISDPAGVPVADAVAALKGGRRAVSARAPREAW